MHLVIKYLSPEEFKTHNNKRRHHLHFEVIRQTQEQKGHHLFPFRETKDQVGFK